MYPPDFEKFHGGGYMKFFKVGWVPYIVRCVYPSQMLYDKVRLYGNINF